MEEASSDYRRASLSLGHENSDGENAKNHDDAVLSEKLDLVLKLLSNLQECFDEKIETDRHKNVLFDNMHRELTNYRNGILEKNIDTMAVDIIQLTDSVYRYIHSYENAEPNKNNYSALLSVVKGISEDLRDILYRQNIEPYSVLGDDVDIRRQKIIQTVETDDESQDNKIAVRLAEGYEKSGKIVRPERIKIFKYNRQEKR